MDMLQKRKRERDIAHCSGYMKNELNDMQKWKTKTPFLNKLQYCSEHHTPLVQLHGMLYMCMIKISRDKREIERKYECYISSPDN